VACGKTAYVMERLQVEGEIFHNTCFKCTYCNSKLSLSSFAKAPDGKYYCKVHYQQLFKRRGRYSIKASDGEAIGADDAEEGAEESPEAAAPAAADPAAAPAADTADASALDPRVRFEDSGKRWTVEGVEGGQPVQISGQEKHHTVLVYKCKNATVAVSGKVNSVSIDTCTKTQVVMEDIISAVEVINCKALKFQVSGSCPSASVDKTDGCNVFLMSEQAKAVKLSTSKHSDVQVTYMNGDDCIEKPIPEQFVHGIQDDGSIKSRVSSLYSTVATAGGGAADVEAEAPEAAAEAAEEAEAEPDPRVKFEDSGRRWTVEAAEGGQPITVKVREKHHTVLVYKCKNATVQIRGKVNSVAIDSCVKTQVVMDSVISAVEVTNSKSIKFQVSGSCPSASVDKTDGCNAYLLSERARRMELSTSKHSDVQLTFMQGEDCMEKPVPEQFVHSIQADGSIASVVSGLYS